MTIAPELSTQTIVQADPNAERTNLRRPRRSWLPPVPLLIILAILILVPAAFVLLAAFSTDVPRPGNITFDLTWENFTALASPAILGGALNSVVIALLGTLVALIIGGTLAFLTARANIPFKPFVYMIGLIPMFLPSYVGALAWAMLASPQAGLLNIAARDLGLPGLVDVYTIPGIVLVCGMFYAPYAFLLMHSAMTLMNPDLEDAAAVHGGSPRSILKSVTFPLALPAILGSGLLVFILIFENFPVAQALATPGGIDTLPTYIYRMMNAFPSQGNQAAALATVMVLFVVLLTWAQKKALAGRSYTTVTGKGVRARLFSLGRMRWVMFALALVYFLAAIVLPLLALFVTSIQTSPFTSSIGDFFRAGATDFAAYGRVFTDGRFWSATGNSLVVSVLAALFGTIMAFVTAYLVYRTTARGRGLLEGVSMIPLAIPAIVLGMGLLWTWLVMPIPLYGTLWVMVIAFLAVQAPQGLRSVAASIRSTDRDLEDSAVVLGVRRSRAIGYVTIPLMRTALASSFLLLLMLSMRELTVPLFLYTRDTEILSIFIFERFETGGARQDAAAISLIYCALMFVLAWLPRRLGRGLNE